MRARSFWRGGCLSRTHPFAPLKLALNRSADEVGAPLIPTQDSFNAVERPGRQPRRGEVLVNAWASH